jgi:hypothetical protein
MRNGLNWLRRGLRHRHGSTGDSQSTAVSTVTIYPPVKGQHSTELIFCGPFELRIMDFYTLIFGTGDYILICHLN